MSPVIVRRSFVELGGSIMEREEFLRSAPGREDVGSWSAFCAFFPGAEVAALRKAITRRNVDVVPSIDPPGAWVRGGHWDLQKSLEEIRAQ